MVGMGTVGLSYNLLEGVRGQCSKKIFWFEPSKFEAFWEFWGATWVVASQTHF